MVISIAAIGLSISGDLFSKIMVEQQPMKMAAAEGLYETQEDAPFSVLSLGEINGGQRGLPSSRARSAVLPGHRLL